MPFRGDDAGDALTAPVATGELRLEVGPRHVGLRLGAQEALVEGDRVVLRQHGRRVKEEVVRLVGPAWVARDVPHEDLGVWVAVDPGAARVRRVFACEPRSLYEADGLDALRALDRLVQRLRQALAQRIGPTPRAIELGRGHDKLLVIERDDASACYQRPLFQGEAGRSFTAHADGRIVIHEARPIELRVRSRYGVTVLGDYLRFSDPDGLDLGRVSIPWIDREDRIELARRIGERIDAGPTSAPPNKF